MVDWIDAISQTWARRSANTLELARLVSQARESLRVRGQWSELFRSGRRLPFKKRKAEQLVLIGQVCGKANAHVCAQLPSASRTLYCLALLGLPAVQKLVGAKRIHPGLSLREANALLAEHSPDARKQAAASALERHLARFAHFVHANVTA